MTKPKAVLLFSGGLDSVLAAHILKREGISFHGFYAHTVFSHQSYRQAVSVQTKKLQALSAPLKVIDISAQQIEMIKKPRFGLGANLNPCIDCKILIFKRARNYMEEINAAYIASGEVLGERPMSQRRDLLNIIEKNAGMKGLIVRPLSAKLLSPTIPEINGWIDREHLYRISGRGRSLQFALAKEFGIEDYPTPSGGCLLTNPSFCRRVKDLLRHMPDFGVRQARYLTVGRHFRLTPQAKLIVARDETECEKLEALSRPDTVRFLPFDIPGPFAVGVGAFSHEDIHRAAVIVASYTKKSDRDKQILVRHTSSEERITVSAQEADKEKIKRFLI